MKNTSQIHSAPRRTAVNGRESTVAHSAATKGGSTGGSAATSARWQRTHQQGYGLHRRPAPRFVAHHESVMKIACGRLAGKMAADTQSAHVGEDEVYCGGGQAARAAGSAAHAVGSELGQGEHGRGELFEQAEAHITLAVAGGEVVCHGLGSHEVVVVGLTLLPGHCHLGDLHSPVDATGGCSEVEEHDVAHLKVVAHGPVDETVVANEIVDAILTAVVGPNPVVHMITRLAPRPQGPPLIPPEGGEDTGWGVFFFVFY